MDDDLPKQPETFFLGSDLERHSVAELQALEAALERELARVQTALAARQNVRAAAEALFKGIGIRPAAD